MGGKQSIAPTPLTEEEKLKPFLVAQYARATAPGKIAYSVQLLHVMRTVPWFDHSDWLIFQDASAPWSDRNVLVKRDGSLKKVYTFGLGNYDGAIADGFFLPKHGIIPQMIAQDTGKDVLTYDRLVFLLRNNLRCVEQKWVDCNGDIYKYFAATKPMLAPSAPLAALPLVLAYPVIK